MCKFKSGIILKSRVVLAPEGNESHSDLLESLNIRDDYMGASKVFVRVELLPPNGDRMSDISNWRFNVDQDIRPDWFEEDKGRYEKEFRDAVAAYMEEFKAKLGIIMMGGCAWTPFKKKGDLTYYMLFGALGICHFGNNNNYAKSNARERVINGDLARKMKAEYGDRLVPITTDLLSLDGLDDYGVVEGDLLAIPTLDLYRECRKSIPPIDNWYWLATPDSTPSGVGSDCVQCVGSDGDVRYADCDCDGGVRPFFILKA